MHPSWVSEVGKEVIRSYVALGDSFTEGLNDPYGTDVYRGWADRLAEHLDAASPGLLYANLAVRGKVLRQVAAEQVPKAVAMNADLYTISAGGNDMIRPGADPDALAVVYRDALAALRKTGARVVVFTGFDPKYRGLNGRASDGRFRGKVATFNMHIRSIADRLGLTVVDLWSMPVLNADPAWHEDRLHLTPEGHARLAHAVAERLGVPVEGDWRAPWPVLPVKTRQEALRDDLYWARTYFAPWVQRRIKGVSSGDGRTPKRPELKPL
ncbi:SGNH/GDSL hydrolase family protein [Actinocorallia sp. A-T 12471]|uniref:SGNH/GDSL hydrolase family protein n=1 Tax=Actinocorallia sp. A-T 12471 TaxID=3089813 RepID=UPI0029D26160|nr:SGNH/GDSL hydrolase family protein [Actinocorallia sp. A-T 12471]MDX6739500.1 SGNH/GDSL hydrolase family protein [Actinocorallia sp. A-T 12471]